MGAGGGSVKRLGGLEAAVALLTLIVHPPLTEIVDTPLAVIWPGGTDDPRWAVRRQPLVRDSGGGGAHSKAVAPIMRKSAGKVPVSWIIFS